MRGILQKAHAFVGNIEENNRCPQNRAGSDDLHIEDVGNPHQQEDQHLLEDALESNFTGQFLVNDRTHHTGDVVNDDKGKQCINQSVTAAQEVAEPPSDGCKDKLNRVSEFLHVESLLKYFCMIEGRPPHGRQP